MSEVNENVENVDTTPQGTNENVDTNVEVNTPDTSNYTPLRVKFNHEDRELTYEEAISYSQKEQL